MFDGVNRKNYKLESPKIRREEQIEEEEEETQNDGTVREKCVKKFLPSTSYNVYGFPLVLQVWAYEAIPTLVDEMRNQCISQNLLVEN